MSRRTSQNKSHLSSFIFQIFLFISLSAYTINESVPRLLTFAERSLFCSQIRRATLKISRLVHPFFLSLSHFSTLMSSDSLVHQILIDGSSSQSMTVQGAGQHFHGGGGRGRGRLGCYLGRDLQPGPPSSLPEFRGKNKDGK